MARKRESGVCAAYHGACLRAARSTDPRLLRCARDTLPYCVRIGQVRPDGDTRADRRIDAGGGWGRSRRSQFFAPEAKPPARYRAFPLCGACRRSSRFVAGGVERGQRSYRPMWAEVGAPVRAYGEADIVRICTMPPRLAHAPLAEIRVRKTERADLDALMALEQRVFATDRLSRRSLHRFLSSPTAEVIVAEEGGGLGGTALVLV